MIQNLKQNLLPDPGAKGLPESYPVPPHNPDLLFYIQRNQNKNTVVYEVNRTATGFINRDFPLHAYWIRYKDGGEIAELNYFQNKMAYGYESKMIDSNTFEFNFVSYKQMKLYITESIDNQYQVLCKINDNMSILSNIYVYAEELGVFPNVKFIEFYGQELNSNMFSYQKIMIEP